MIKSFKLLIVYYWHNIMQMLSVYDKPILLILAMLQFFAPLMHAHTGNNHANLGIHVPGLESYLDIQNAASFKKVNSAYQSEGSLVVVDAGIKNFLDMTVPNAETQFCEISAWITTIALSSYYHNFSPQEETLIPPNKVNLPQPARAPPLNL